MLEMYRGVWVVTLREILRFLADRTRMISSFIWPLMFLVVFGAGFSRIVGGLSGEVNFVQFMYPGIIAMTVVMSSLFAGTSVVADREYGFLRELLVAPLSRSGIILGKALGGSLTAIAQGTIMLIIGPFLGLSVTPLIVIKLLPTLLILSLTLSGLGILIATRIRSQQGFQFLLNLMVFPLIFLSGVFFPIDGVPRWLQVIAKVNPLSYGVDAIRQIFIGPGTINPVAERSGIEIVSTGITVFGHRMGILEDVALLSIIGISLMVAGVWSFTRSEV